MSALDFMRAGTEAMHYQIKSKLYSELTNFFQECIDYSNSLEPTDHIKTTSDMHDYRVSEIHKYVHSRKQELIEIIERNTGFELNDLFIQEPFPDDPGYGFFAMATDPDLGSGWVDAYSRMTSTDYSREYVVGELSELSEQVDIATGTMTGDGTYGGGRKLRTALYFDYKYSFCLYDYFSKDAQALTASEIAAIIMHEIGHCVTITSNLGNSWETHNRARHEMIDIVKNIKTAKDARSAAKELREIYLAQEKKYKNNPKFKKLFGKDSLANLLTVKAVAYAEELDDSYFSTALSIAGITLFTVFMMLVILTIATTPIIIIITALAEEIERTCYINNNRGDKSSDVTTNFTNTYLIERWADEYATKMGCADALASGLAKLDYNFKYTYYYSSSHRVRNATLFSIWCKVYHFIMIWISPFAYFDTVGYENMYFRIKRIRENTLGAFKTEKLDQFTANYLLDQLESIEDNMNDVKRLGDTALARAMQNILRNVMSPVRWVQLISNANLTRDFEILANNIDALNNNAFHAMSYKIRYSNRRQ